MFVNILYVCIQPERKYFCTKYKLYFESCTKPTKDKIFFFNFLSYMYKYICIKFYLVLFNNKTLVLEKRLKAIKYFIASQFICSVFFPVVAVVLYAKLPLWANKRKEKIQVSSYMHMRIPKPNTILQSEKSIFIYKSFFPPFAS